MTIGGWLAGLLIGAAMAATGGPPAPELVPYGKSNSQLGVLWLPARGTDFPVVVLVHGGCWQRAFGLDLMDPLAADLRAQGIAVWNIEYRRMGEAGGGFPGTFADVGAAFDALRGLAQRRSLDLSRIVAVGHSAGGHLALWAAARARLPPDSPLRGPEPPLPLAGVVTLAGIDDLAAYRARGPACGGAPIIDALVDASRPEPLADTSPRALLPLGVRQLIVSGNNDRIVPPIFGGDYAQAAQAAGDRVDVLILPGDHFALIDPASADWREVRTRLRTMLGLPPQR